MPLHFIKMESVFYFLVLPVLEKVRLPQRYWQKVINFCPMKLLRYSTLNSIHDSAIKHYLPMG